MDALRAILSWGSPVGIAMFFMLTGIGAYFLFKGLAMLNSSEKEKNKSSNKDIIT